MSMVLIIMAMVYGPNNTLEMEKIIHVAEQPFNTKCAWELVWFEENSIRQRRLGKLDTCRNGHGLISVFPRAPWTIVGSRISGELTQGFVDLDIEWGGECMGNTTIYGIYTLSNNHLMLCFAFKENQRPNDFTTSANDGRTLLLFKRIK